MPFKDAGESHIIEGNIPVQLSIDHYIMYTLYRSWKNAFYTQDTKGLTSDFILKCQ